MRKKVFVDLLRRNLPCRHAYGDRAYGSQDLILTAVVRRKIKVHPRIVRCALLRLLHAAQKALRKAVTPSDETHAHMLCMHLCNLFFKERVKEIQQEIDLAVRTLPILRRERVDRQHLDPHLRRRAHDPLQRTCTRLVSRRA